MKKQFKPRKKNEPFNINGHITVINSYGQDVTNIYKHKKRLLTN